MIRATVGLALVALCACRGEAPQHLPGGALTSDPKPPIRETGPPRAPLSQDSRAWPNPPVDSARFVGKQVDPTLDEMARLVKAQVITLERDGGQVGGASAARSRTIESMVRVLEEGQHQLRVLLEEDGYRLAVLMAKDCFALQPMVPVELRLESGELPRDGFLRFHPGTPFRVRPPSGDRVGELAVDYNERPLIADGYLPTAAVGLVASAKPNEVLEPSPGAADSLTLTRSHGVLDAPGGIAFASLHAHDDAPVIVKRLQTKGRSVYIRFHTRHVELEGWLDLDRPSQHRRVFAPSVRMSSAQVPAAQLAESSALYASASGPQVGVAVQQLRVTTGEGLRHGGRSQVNVFHSQVGAISVWVDTAALSNPQLK